jgi:predicted nuclease of restriction endonuclease-like (RecB) superfamily
MIDKLHQPLFIEVATLIQKAQHTALRSVNKTMIDLYWQIGQYIHVQVNEKTWGKAVVTELAQYISKNLPNTKGFSDKNLWRMKQFYDTYHNQPSAYELCCQTTWTNNLLIFSKSKNIEERLFYLNLTINERWTKRELSRQIDSAYYERTMIANQKLSPLARELPQDITNVFKDTYIFEFLDLPKPFSEKQLKKNLLAQLKAFVLELGTDFVFMGEEYRIQVGTKDFFIDLLFFHRELSCLVSFELKINDFKPEYLGKMDFYLEALDRDVRKAHENPSIGVLLCKSKDDEIVEYAMSRNISPMLVADYETKFIDKKLLQQKWHELFQ